MSAACVTPTQPAAPLVDGLPITLDVVGREVLVVGAGPVSARRARTFMEAGAVVTVVAPQISPEMVELALGSPSGLGAPGSLTVSLREMCAADLESPWLVHTATGCDEVDRAIAQACHERRLWCITAGDAAVGTARVPARTAVRTPTGAVRIAVDSGDPRRSVRVGRHLARSLATSPRALRARRPDSAGWVALVGGSSERDLLTVRAQRLVHAADVLIVDGTLDPELRAELDDDVEIVELAGLGHPRRAAAIAVAKHAQGCGVVRIVPAAQLGAEVDSFTGTGIMCELVPGVLHS